MAHFRAVRAAFGISAQQFREAFRRRLPEQRDLTTMRQLHESLSEGASGSFFIRWAGRTHVKGRTEVNPTVLS